ncbi:sigma-54-dependent transcriptional regulator [Sinanaerobacter chloroacetimidivorans]|jgi:two-component system response regulator AtoC|uniref:Stage 0 sporulation protein A homolog n=1 Tax=Sinanaerobacter chloroacetimidivorans TaxID=2818044 RepID=A0A8J8B2G5_9FIRM|nr:sigma-54 dependent transcriptional regulator [Sinanaerobacter chloroacetimidivorans]MBR0598702.1 sigma-54-dependent Fis family transcriptional regulator [Sinanaerobacter chloroacetimidivorans]
MKIKVLIIDDELMICKSLEAGLSDMGYDVTTAQNSQSALKAVTSCKPQIVLTDMRLGTENGIDLIDDIKKIDADIEVIVMTAYSDIASAVLAIKKGAFDYINKPFELEEIKLILERAYQNYKMKNKLLILEKQNQFFIENMIGQSDKMKDVFNKINILSENDNVTVLIRGETGTGKELVADAIHNKSIRKDSPILKINCSTIPAQLVESELFGFERNAFTGADSRKKGLLEIANGGTVFLDELGEIPLEMQAKLLRFLEERKFRRIGGLEDIEVDIRIIAATNKNLEQAVKEKTFREDLYYRLNVIPVEVPPLRERGKDILLIADYFLEKFNRSFKKSIQGFDMDAKTKLMSYSWPGNIRELKNMIERIVILHNDAWISVQNLPVEIQNFKGDQRNTESIQESHHIEDEHFSLDEKMDGIEKEYLLEALEKSGWNQTRAAAMLGISRFSLKRKMEKFLLS